MKTYLEFSDGVPLLVIMTSEVFIWLFLFPIKENCFSENKIHYSDQTISFISFILDIQIWKEWNLLKPIWILFRNHIVYILIFYIFGIISAIIKWFSKFLILMSELLRLVAWYFWIKDILKISWNVPLSKQTNTHFSSEKPIIYHLLKKLTLLFLEKISLLHCMWNMYHEQVVLFVVGKLNSKITRAFHK